MHKSQDGDGETIKADSNLKPSTITAGQNKNSIDHFYKGQWTRKYNNYSKENTENKDRWLEMSNLNLIPFPHKVTIKAIKVSVQFIKDASSDTYIYFFFQLHVVETPLLLNPYLQERCKSLTLLLVSFLILLQLLHKSLQGPQIAKA